MSGILNIGTRALQANQAVLQTTGNNIANVNTPGYSRQSVLLQNVAGQFSGSGYYGNGVEALTVERLHSEFLTRQAALSSSVAAADTTRLEQLQQLEDIFQGGSTGLGAAVSDMLNSFSDIVSAPTDLTARSVVLTRADELAARFRAASGRLSDLRQGVTGALTDAVSAVNSLAARIAAANEEVARALGTGQTPNDLLDQRDQLIRELSQYVQTTIIPADDGSVGVFLAGSQPLVLGTMVSPVGLVADEFGDPAKTKLAIQRGGVSFTLEEAALGGGRITGLLRFQNSDLVDAANLLGRMALAIGSAVNAQQRLGLDLNGKVGGDLFQLDALPAGRPAAGNGGNASLQVTVQTTPTSGSTALAASNYEISFTALGTSVTRLSDGQVTNFAPAAPIQVDGLAITVSAGPPVDGDRFLITPFSSAAASMSTAFASPRALAMASPVAASAGAANQGTLAVASLAAKSVANASIDTYTITFSVAAGGGTTYSVTNKSTGTLITPAPPAVQPPYIPDQAIVYAPATTPATPGWSLTLKGTAQAGDSFTVQANAYPMLSAGNAEAMLALRDVAMFDGAALTDGYASAMSQIGVRVQSAGFAAAVSQSIASNIEKDRTSVSGVNLDEEAAKLLQYQQAYQASAKMLQIAQSIFDTLLQTVSR